MCGPLSCFSSKEYISGFDQNTGAVQTTELNCFERLFRFIFGMYEETHLEKLQPLAQRAVLVPDNPNLQQITELLKKTSFSHENYYSWESYTPPNAPIDEKFEFYSNYNSIDNHIYLSIDYWEKEEKNFCLSITLKPSSEAATRLDITEHSITEGIDPELKAKMGKIFTTFLINILANTKKFEDIFVESAIFSSLEFKEGEWEQDTEADPGITKKIHHYYLNKYLLSYPSPLEDVPPISLNCLEAPAVLDIDSE